MRVLPATLLALGLLLGVANLLAWAHGGPAVSGLSLLSLICLGAGAALADRQVQR